MSFSVLLSVFNKEKPSYFDRALRSIWEDQTLKPGQIVLVKDGTLSDDLNKVIGRWKAKLGNKLKVVALERNVGLANALNKGLQFCEFELVARMDTDDISLPPRFQRQVQFMHQNPEISVSSSFIEEMDDEGKVISIKKLPVEHVNIIKFGKTRNPINHSVSIFRKSKVIEVGGYPSFRKSQDYALWSLMLSKGYKFANLPEILLKMQTGSGLMKRRGLEYFRYEYKILKFQKKIGFISSLGFIKNTFLRFILRFVPDRLKGLFYKHLRK